ncbi:MAG: hypothetical protein K5871_10325 [Lachnospiraceae bacterium]|nr:hypothetical protein [Lachnospiraceae bacterium]
MSINIQAKTDTSFLFSNLPSSQGDFFNSMNWLKDYGLVKSGAYSKLMKAYYSKDGSEEEPSKEVSNLVSDKAKAVSANKTASDSYNKVSESAASVQDSVRKIQEAAEKDTDLLISTVKNFVTSFNSMIDAAADSSVKDDRAISSRVSVLSSLSSGYSEKMTSVGILAKSDGKLEVDKDKLKKADAGDIKKLFADKSSYGYAVSMSAEMVQSNAQYVANRQSLYGASGTANAGSYGYSFDLFT